MAAPARRAAAARAAPAIRDPAVDHAVELLSALGAVRARRMFGGWGFYVDDCFVALIAGDQLYLKSDATSRDAYAAAGSHPFVYSGGGRTVEMSYQSAPAEALESPAAMLPWARMALQAALSARAAGATRPRRRSAPPTTPQRRR